MYEDDTIKKLEESFRTWGTTEADKTGKIGQKVSSVPVVIPSFEEEKDISLAKALVLDNGTYISKNGFAGEDQPRSAFPTLIGYPISPGEREYYIGEEVNQLLGVVNPMCPIEHGIIKDWKAMENVWHYTFFNDLRIDPSEHPVLITEPPLNPGSNREKMAEILFETFNVPALFVTISPLLSLLAGARNTGCIVDIGDGVTSIVPIYERNVLSQGIRRINFAGRDITSYLRTLFHQKGYDFSKTSEFEIVRDMKEKLCYVALDPEKEIMLAKTVEGGEKTYMLPDGETITVGVERFLAPEAFFNPGVTGKQFDPLDNLICDAVKNCDVTCTRSGSAGPSSRH